MAQKWLDIQGGFAPLVFKFGNGIVGTTETTVWDGGPTVFDGHFAWGNGQQISIVSDSIEDAFGGTGAIALRVDGIDGVTGFRRFATYALNGTTPVVSAVDDTWLAINSMAIVATQGVGPGTANVGNISVTAVGGATPLMAKILPGNGRTLMAVYMCPRNYYGEFCYVQMFTEATKTVTFRIYGVTAELGPYEIISQLQVQGDNDITRDLTQNPQIVPPLGRIVFNAFTDVATSSCGANFSIRLRPYDPSGDADPLPGAI